MYADTCGKAYAVASSNIKSQDVSQIKLLICITDQVSSHYDVVKIYVFPPGSLNLLWISLWSTKWQW